MSACKSFCNTEWGNGRCQQPFPGWNCHPGPGAGEEGALCPWQHLLKVELPLHWSRERGRGRLQPRCHRLSLFLLRVSRFPWINTYPFKISRSKRLFFLKYIYHLYFLSVKWLLHWGGVPWVPHTPILEVLLLIIPHYIQNCQRHSISYYNKIYTP